MINNKTMKFAFSFTLVMILGLSSVCGQESSPQNQSFFNKKQPFAHTYSIVARDPETGEMAAAVQSHWFSVGSIVIWGKSGVGVVATQSFVNPAYGPEGLRLMESGRSAKEAMIILLADDEGKEVRQVAMLDNSGEVFSFTGKNCIDHAGNIIGDNYSVQANMMLTDKVPKAMSDAYKSADTLALAERVLAALKAAEAVGGDIRGKQSAALIVVSGEKDVPVWEDKLVDLRVDDHAEPLEELERLLRVHRAYEHMNQGDVELEHGNMEQAVEEYRAAMKMFPDNQEMKFWTAVTLIENGKVTEAKKLMNEVLNGENGENWKELLGRLPKVGLLQVSNYTKLIK